MTWDIKDVAQQAIPGVVDSRHPSGVPEPASPAMVPTLALLHGLDNWLDEGDALEHLSAAEQEEARLAGLVPGSEWAARRRLMFRGVIEMK